MLPSASGKAAIRRVLVTTGHLRSASLCPALADAYLQGVREAGLDVRTLDMSTLSFDPDVYTVSPLAQPLEPDLAHAWDAICWADHLLLAFAVWRGVGPANLYGFLNRMLMPDLAFSEYEGRFEGLLKGKAAHLVTTMDMPA